MLLISWWLFLPIEKQGSENAQECHTSLHIPSTTQVISVQNADRVTQLAELEHGDHINDFTVIPNSDAIVITTSTNAHVYGLSDDSPEISFLGDCLAIDRVAFSSDSSQVAIVKHDTTTIELWDSSTNSVVDYIVSTGSRITSLAFDPTSNVLGWATSDVDEIASDAWVRNGNLFLYDIEAESEILAFYNVADIVTELHFFQFGDIIIFRGVYPGYDFDMQVWNLETEMPHAIRESWFVIPAYSPNKSVIALGTTMSLGISDDFSFQLEIWDPQTDTILSLIHI